MVNPVKRAIADSKRKRDFKHRQKDRFDRHHKKKHMNEDKYVERKRQRRDEDSVEEEGDGYDKIMKEEDPELDRAVDNVGDDYGEEFDETEFLKNADELDLPEEESEDEEIEKDL